jgi:hypothetical protein
MYQCMYSPNEAQAAKTPEQRTAEAEELTRAEAARLNAVSISRTYARQTEHLLAYIEHMRASRR